MSAISFHIEYPIYPYIFLHTSPTVSTHLLQKDRDIFLKDPKSQTQKDMAFSRGLRKYPGSRKKKKNSTNLKRKIPRRNYFSATLRTPGDAIPRARENLTRAEEERPERIDLSGVDKNYISSRLNEITEDVLRGVREDDEEETIRTADEMFRLPGSIRDLNDSLRSTREKRQVNDLKNIMSNLEGVFEDINQTKKIVERGDVAASRYNLAVQKMKSSVEEEEEESRISKTPKSKLGHDIEAQLDDIDRLLYGNSSSPVATFASERETKRSPRRAPRAYNNLLRSIQKLENKLSGVPMSNNDNTQQDYEEISESSSRRGRRRVQHHPPVITPLRDGREVLHAPHRTTHLLNNSDDDLRLDKKSGGTVPFYGASSRSTETALLFFQGKVREVRKMIARNTNEMEDLQNIIVSESQNAVRLQSNLNQLVPLVVELMTRQRKDDKEWSEIVQSIREPLLLLSKTSSDGIFENQDKNRAELEASELPDIATYVSHLCVCVCV